LYAKFRRKNTGNDRIGFCGQKGRWKTLLDCIKHAQRSGSKDQKCWRQLWIAMVADDATKEGDQLEEMITGLPSL
jgi:hypothetical protein